MNLTLRFLHNKILDKLTPLFVVEMKLEKLSFQISKPKYDLLLILGYKWNDYMNEKKNKFFKNVIILLGIQDKNFGFIGLYFLFFLRIRQRY